MVQQKRTNVKSLIKKQLNGTTPVTKDIDTQDHQVLEHIEADIMYNPDNYTKVEIFGVDVIVKVDKEDK